MKILLVKPYQSKKTIAGSDFVELEPLELEYLAAGLTDHDVRLIDMRFDRDLETVLLEFRPDVVACTAYSVHVYNTLEIMRTAKRLVPEAFTVVGGHHATVAPADFAQSEIDAVVIGEGVFTLKNIVEAIERGTPLNGIPGVAFRHDNQVVVTDNRTDIDAIDRLPQPDRSISERYRSHYFYLQWKPAALIRASVGCAYHCSFCPIPTATQGKLKYRRPELVAEEIKTIKEGFIYFCDDNAFFDRQTMETLGRLLSGENLGKEYFFFSRPDTLVACPDLVELWAEIGLRQVFLGIEAIDAARLATLKKRIDYDTNREAVRILKANGVDPFAGFMVFPDFTRDDFKRLYDFMNELGIYYQEITVLTPAPGSELYRQRIDDLITGDYELYDYLHAVLPTTLSPRTFYKQLANLYIRAYSPLRGMRLKPASGVPISPRTALRTARTAVRYYLKIRRGYTSLSN